MIINKPENILISRTDAIGDVVLTLPMAGVIKHYFPECKIYFLGKTYTEPVIQLSSFTDEFINYDLFLKSENKKEFFRKYNLDTIIHVFPKKDIAVAAKQAGIKNRIGTSHRVYHWLNCNYKINVGRKNSDLHEAQLNLKLLQPFGINQNFTRTEIMEYYGFTNLKPLKSEYISLIDRKKFSLIVHPRSHASAREWGLENFRTLIEQLPKDSFQIFISGSEKEKMSLSGFINELKGQVIDVTGKFNLEEFISFINACDGLIACSTGPLHIAAALNKHVLGLYPPIRPQHPGRWAPVGKKAEHLVAAKSCNQCKGDPPSCSCMDLILPHTAAVKIMNWKKEL